MLQLVILAVIVAVVAWAVIYMRAQRAPVEPR